MKQTFSLALTRKSKFVLMIALMLSPFVLSAQSLRKKAVLTKNDGTTLSGWVKYKSWARKFSSISFYTDSLSSKREIYTVDQLSAFDIPCYDRYERATFTLNNGMDSTVQITAWLRVIVTGNRWSLYQFSDHTDHFLVKEGDKYEELRVTDNQKFFRNQLAVYAYTQGPNEKLYHMIEQCEYRESDLREIFVMLGGNGDMKNERFPCGNDAMAKTRMSFVLMAGGGVSSLSIRGDKTYLETLTFGRSYLPYIGAGLEITGGRGLQRVAIRIELAYTSMYYQAEGTSITSSRNKMSYDLKQSNITPSVAVLFRLVEKPSFRLMTGPALAYTQSSYKQNELRHTYPQPLTIEDYTPVAKGWLSSNLKLIASYRKKAELGAYYQFWGETTKSMRYSFNPKTFVLWLGYRF